MVIEFLKKNLFFMVIGAAILIFLIVSRDGSATEEEYTPIEEAKETLDSYEKEPDSTKVIVDIKGQVAVPGVYEIASDSRVNEAIKIAGGFTVDADQSVVNLAQRVQDEMVILIPKKGEISSVGSIVTAGGDTKVRINYAEQAEIETLNGIGPAKAQAIIQYREENGNFREIDDLLEVPGIGEKTLDNLRDAIQIP